MKTYTLTRTTGEKKEIQADWFTFDASTQSIEFHKTGQDGAISAFGGVDSVEEKAELPAPTSE